MAGSFTSPGASSSTKMHVGKANRPKRTASAGMGIMPKPEYPITDAFASDSIPGFADRRAKTNNKSGWNSRPGKPPAGRLAQKVSAPERGRGRTI